MGIEGLTTALLPKLKDLQDLRDNLLHFVGLRPERPRFPRYSYFEKFDYLVRYEGEWGAPLVVSAITEIHGALESQTAEFYNLTGSVGEPPAAGPMVEGSFVSAFEAGSETVTEDRQYTYDVLRNWVGDEWRAPGVAWEYNAERNRLLRSPEHSYEYDEGGYVVRRDAQPIVWTAAGRMASIGNASFAWDLEGRPVSSRMGGGEGAAIELRHLFGGRVVADAAGAPRQLELGDFSRVQVPLEQHLAEVKNYRRNQYELPEKQCEMVRQRWAGYIQRYGYGQ